jgi:hypothetical protein
MKHKNKNRLTRLETKLGLPDLEHAKLAVIVSLRSFESQRSYRHSIDEFVAWYCSAPRLSLNKTVVLRYRLHLEDCHLAAGTINVRLAAVRRLAYEAADSGLLSRSRSRHSPCKGSEETRMPTGKLVDCGAGSGALATA